MSLLSNYLILIILDLKAVNFTQYSLEAHGLNSIIHWEPGLDDTCTYAGI